MIKISHKVNSDFIVAFCALSVFGSITIFSSTTLAQTYPSKPIRIVVPSMPASGPDIIARLIGTKLTESLGQPIVIDNRAGASGRMGSEVASRAAPDGYTLMLLTSQHAIVDAMYRDLKYNLIKDFSPISLLGTVPFILVVNPSIPVTSVKELVTLAKSRQGGLQYGSGGSGSPQHLSAEIFKFMTGTDILHVPYKGSAMAVTGTMTGEVHMAISVIPQSLPMVKSGKIRALGVTSAKRTPMIPDLPSIAETVPGYEFIGFYGLLAPTKTPPAILSKLNIEIIKALSTSVVRERMTGLGVDVLGTSQKDLASFIGEQLEKMREAVKLSGAKPED